MHTVLTPAAAPARTEGREFHRLSTAAVAAQRRRHRRGRMSAAASTRTLLAERWALTQAADAMRQGTGAGCTTCRWNS
jgi:hypothetical protein